jgi:hypothetical protein
MGIVKNALLLVFFAEIKMKGDIPFFAFLRYCITGCGLSCIWRAFGRFLLK